MRAKPGGADRYGWKQFEKWSDKKGVGDDREDWDVWWECWMAASIAAIDRIETGKE
jgi:hypothetical protein